jgi:hypothetical protein
MLCDRVVYTIEYRDRIHLHHSFPFSGFHHLHPNSFFYSFIHTDTNHFHHFSTTQQTFTPSLDPSLNRFIFIFSLSYSYDFPLSSAMRNYGVLIPFPDLAVIFT